MRVLLDGKLPHALAPLLVGHDVLTVQGCGWARLTNGALLREARGRIDGFLPMDANLEYQQHLIGMPLGVAVLHARSNRPADLLPLVGPVLEGLQDLTPGEVCHIGA